MITDVRRWCVVLVRAGAAGLFGVALLFPAVAEVQADGEDVDSGYWALAPRLPQSQLLASLVELPDGRVLVSAGGALTYDPRSGVWHQGTALNDTDVPSFGTRHFTLLPDGRVLAAGGGQSQGITPGSVQTSRRAAIYDAVDDSWSGVAEMNTLRRDPSLTTLSDGTVLAAGGEHGSGASLGSGWLVHASAERYDPNTDTWSRVGDMHEERRGHSAILLDDGRVVVIGGRGTRHSWSPAVERFDPESNEWEVIAELPESLLGHQANLLSDGMILITGGSVTSSHPTAGVPLNEVWLLNPESGELEPGPEMNVARTGHTAVRLHDGRILVAGGMVEDGDTTVRTASTEIFDPETGSWSMGPAMSHGRAGHQAVAVGHESHGAQVYLIGGQRVGEGHVEAEVFYPELPGIADRQPPPADDDPAHRYFPPTGHYLSFAFKDFWDASGGLPVFGYPLTREFDEFNPELGETRTSQYVERQRFEYHPEHAGTPYDVQLGRLGYADADERNLLGTDAFQSVDESALDPDCRYFAETEQAACGAFLSYWKSHGLDFGDEGVSFRESLALSGYPISQEFVDPDTGLTTQYFERARFELHPDNPEEHRVLLGRLGADIVENRDW